VILRERIVVIKTITYKSDMSVEEKEKLVKRIDKAACEN